MSELTEAEYNAALERIDALMDARPGTPEGEELDTLVSQIEPYEKLVPDSKWSLRLGPGTPYIIGPVTIFSWGLDIHFPRTIFTFVWRGRWRAHLSPDGTPDSATWRWH